VTDWDRGPSLSALVARYRQPICTPSIAFDDREL